MTTYKIKSFTMKESPDVFRVMTYTGQEEKYEVSSAFSCLNNLLLHLYSCLKTNDKKIVFSICYANHTLSYYFSMDGNEHIDNSEFIGGCKIEKSDDELPRYPSQRDFHGGIDPQYLDKRSQMFLDQLIELFPDEHFKIIFALTKPKPSFPPRDDTLVELIKKYGEKGERSPGLLDKPLAFLNGQGKNRDVAAETEYRKYLAEYYARKRPICSSNDYYIAFQGSEQFLNGVESQISTMLGSVSQYTIPMCIKDKISHLNNQDVSDIPIDYFSALFAFPTKPVYGLEQHKPVYFDVPSVDKNIGNLTLGYLQNGSYKTGGKNGVPINININELTKHVFIPGVTGSGKTTTIKYLLDLVYQADVPFLVLEPAKNEYRYIDKYIDSIKMYMPGKACGGLQLNPFYFPENSNLHIQTHIDHIKSIFVAAFPMYGPMPYILEIAIYNIYRKKGWDILSGKTLRKEDKYPTLEDLLYEIDIATESIGYSNDLQNDVKGALKVRISSLITGAKGSILNTTELTDIEALLSHPSLMSLEGIGDSQEKVFIMGLVLLFIYEYYIAKGIYSQDEQGNNKLKHLLVFEEAHRLLENVQANNNSEVADMKGKALETFNNILSEIRAYGQGIIIADQIPVKLSPDVVKNTNLKIIHRLFDKDDREFVGHSIGLDDTQINHLIRLNDGEAVVFHGKIGNAAKIVVPAEQKHYKNSLDDTKKQDDSPLRYSFFDNPFYFEEYCKCFRTSLLLGMSEQDFKTMIRKITSEDINPEDYDKQLRKISNKLLNQTKLADSYEPNYTKRLDLFDKISQSPYTQWQIMLTEYTKHSVVETEERKAAIFELFYPKKQYAHIFKNLDNVVKNGRFTLHTDEIIRISQCESIFATYILDNKAQSKIISDCIICNVYQDLPTIRDQYFGTSTMQTSPYLYPKSPDNVIANAISDGFRSIKDEIYKTIGFCVYPDNANSGSQQKWKTHIWLPFVLLGVIEVVLALLLLLTWISGNS